ncbi:toxin [Pseudomonas chlororaphis]|uniref:colicin E3/pyocin S6 family cytotoxin n=1 Tax=Pseudomonas chlororaphis TaxID=587753 RepID=UPI000789EBB8|nr:colicin E3/pyocin S6 family cytotoxin [Pseudomonas chlororaphis]AMS17309.1 toxin [Pseudomonas chlororaphis]
MARNRLPPIKNPPSGDGHHITYRDMTPSERAEQEARQNAYERMLVRQQAYADSLASPPRKQQAMAGCTFTKSCKLPDGVMDYLSPSGAIPTDAIKDYGELVLLGGRGADATGNIPLKKISGALPAALGSLALGGEAVASAGAGMASGGVVAGALAGVVAMLWPSSLGDSALYTPEQLDALKEGRTRVRLHLEQRPDGTLKGYGYNTQKQRGWEMVPVVHFAAEGQQQVADFGDGVTLIWTPAEDPSSTSGIPPLEAAPQAPHIWIFPPTEQADTIIVNPIYPPEYKDFILVFPPGSGVRPLYIVLNLPRGQNYHPKPQNLHAFPGLKWSKPKTPKKGGGLRDRWKDKDGTIYEWDSQHGRLEKYNKRGKHLGEFDPITGQQTKPADKTESPRVSWRPQLLRR